MIFHRITEQLQVFKRHGHANQRRVLYSLLLIFALGSFGMSYFLEQQFARLGTFEQYNLFFDADPNLRLQNFAEGSSAGGRNFAHPNLANFIHPPIRVLANLIGIISKDDVREVRYQLALLVVPVANAFKAIGLILVLDLMGFDCPVIIIFSLFNLLSFSQLIWGSIPDHFALSGCLLSGVYYLAMTYRKTIARTVLMIGGGTLLIGITITNLIPYALLLAGAHLQRHSVRNTIMTVTKTLACMLIVNMIIFAMFAPFCQWQENFFDHSQKVFFAKTVPAIWDNKYLTHAIQFPQALMNTIIAPPLTIIDNPFALRMKPHAKYNVQLSCEQPTRKFLYSLPVLLFLGICCYGLWHTRIPKFMIYASLLIVGYNWVLHIFYGWELFLYSQHWQIPLLILMSGMFCLPGRLRKIGIGGGVLFLIIVAIRNITIIHFIFKLLQT